jgi:hypothetical protein
VRAIDLLRELADDPGAGGVGQLGQLTEVVVDDAPGARPLERGAHEERPLDRRRDDDGLAAYERFLVRVC